MRGKVAELIATRGTMRDFYSGAILFSYQLCHPLAFFFIISEDSDWSSSGENELFFFNFSIKITRVKEEKSSFANGL